MLLELSKQDVDNVKTALMTMAKQPGTDNQAMRLLLDLHDKVATAEEAAVEACDQGEECCHHEVQSQTVSQIVPPIMGGE